MITQVRVTAVSNYPGPRTTTIVDGEEVYIASYNDLVEPTTYKVHDFGALRPTLVYNCAYVPALCNNAHQYLGLNVFTAVFHYDLLKLDDGFGPSRSVGRRDSVCPGTWIQTVRTDGLQGPNPNSRCPEKAQQDWHYTDKKGRSGTSKIIMFRETDKYGVETIHPSRLAEIGQKRDPNGSGQINKYIKVGAVMSCDEFPAAAWIEGGDDGDGSATTYCAPFGSVCSGKKYLATEQNWQSYGHNSIRTWLKLQTPKEYRKFDKNSELYTISKFDFKMVSEFDDKIPAVWVEASGVKEYCYGPKGTKSYGCRSDS